MGESRLNVATIGPTLSRLAELNALLSTVSPTDLTPSLISYVFLPLSTILQRNTSNDIPDRVLEGLLNAMGQLMQGWWWTCETKVWEQIFMLSGSIVGGIDGKGKGKARDDETKEAAASCLYALLRRRTSTDAQVWSVPADIAKQRMEEFQEITNSARFVPIVGQTLDSLLATAHSTTPSLQRSSLKALASLLDPYLPDHIIPTILPGVVSTTTKICVGDPAKKGWANGETVALALEVMETVIIKAIGDEACSRDGALRRFTTLDDLAGSDQRKDQDAGDMPKYGTRRTESWMRGTSTRIRIALNALSSLVSHPTPATLRGLARFSSAVIKATQSTLVDTQPLLLSFLLSISLSDYPAVADDARHTLQNLLNQPGTSLHQTLLNIVGNNLSALPRLIATQSDSKTIHACGIIEAVCRLSKASDDPTHLSLISKGVMNLLGPTGGIEKWGWTLLSVLEFVEPQVVVTQTSSGQLFLENDPSSLQTVAFPEPMLKNIATSDGRRALEKMLQSMGSAGGVGCLFAVEWFSSIGQSGTNQSCVAALWCAGRILEGIAEISLSQAETQRISRPDKRLERHVRSLSRAIAELWDKVAFEPSMDADVRKNVEDRTPLVQHNKGLVPLQDTLKILKTSSESPSRHVYQPLLHRALSLQVIAIAAGVLQSRFESLFIHTLYPVLHSLVSPFSFLSSTALATLNYIAFATSFASPSNMLLSNFDYVLDSISRRLSRRWLDVDASKVLAVMVRLVGSDIVDKAGDVVEECFDRLDEYHGYTVIVDGLIAVLNEILRVIEENIRAEEKEAAEQRISAEMDKGRKTSLEDFIDFLPKRFEASLEEEDKTDYGPAPRRPWGKSKEEEEEEKANETGSREKERADDSEPHPTPIQALTKQIILRSTYFLTHDSPTIRTKVLDLLRLSVPVLPESALMPSIHTIWPFILNRLKDSETFVVGAAAALVEALSMRKGEFMFRRIWDDVWPAFRGMLKHLDVADSSSALSRRGKSAIGTESAYTHSHRLYRSILRTMTAALRGVHLHEASFWEVLVLFRRFLGAHVQEELQQCARLLYLQASKHNPDTVWLVLTSTTSDNLGPVVAYLYAPKWGIEANANVIFAGLT